jgi:sodium/bile acid cotransporter 7
MLPILCKRWFLLLLVAGVAVAVVGTNAVQTVLDPIPQQLMVALMLFFMAWTLESRRLWDALKRPKAVILALGVTFGLLPFLGWAASLWFPVMDYRIGMLVCTSVPCTFATAVIWTLLAGGDEAVALLITIASACTSWLFTTGWLGFTTGTAVAIDVPAMMLMLVLFLIVPVSIGQLARIPSPLRKVAERGRGIISVISRLLVLTVVLQAVAAAAQRLRQVELPEHAPYLVQAAGLVLTLHLLGMAAGYWGGVVLGLDRAQRIAVAFAGSQKTLPVGLLLINTYYREYALAVVPMLFYHVGQVLVDTFLAEWFRGGTPQLGPQRAGQR